MTIETTCPSCNSRLKAPPGVKVSCPSCKTVFQMPAPPPEPPAAEIADAIAVPEHLPPPVPQPPEEETQPKRRRRRLYEDEIECPECGEVNHEDDPRCRTCGLVLRRRRSRDRDASGIESLIPYKNAWALWSYYLGVFSLIPCIGIPLGIAGLITGIKALSYASAYPEAKGQVHAWVGIILGALCALGNIAVVVFLVVAARR